MRETGRMVVVRLGVGGTTTKGEDAEAGDLDRTTRRAFAPTTLRTSG